MIYYWVNLTL